MPKALHHDFINANIIINQVGVRCQENAAYAVNPCLAASVWMSLQQRQDECHAGGHFCSALWRLLRDVTQRIIDLLERTF